MALSKTAKIVIGVGLGCFGLLVLGVLAAGGVGAYFVKSKATAAKQRLAIVDRLNIGSALEMHRMRTGAWPSTAEGLGALVKAGELQNVPVDPWGNAYLYELSGDVPSVKSAGPDGKPGTSDDIGGPLKQ